ENVLALPAKDGLRVSAKTGAGIPELLNQIIDLVPPPKGDPAAPFRALIFDAVFDDYRGVIVYVRVVDGKVSLREKIEMAATGARYEVLDIGTFRPKMTAGKSLEAGEVGYLICNIKTLSDVRVGDTVRALGSPAPALPGYRDPQHVVFCGLYPAQANDFEA